MVGDDITVTRGTSLGNYDRPFSSYTASRNGNSVVYTEQGYHRMWREAEDFVVDTLAVNEGMSISDVRRAIDSNKDYQKVMDLLTESVMHEKISRVLDIADKEDMKERERKSTLKKKYTSEQAVERVYSDLKKKYSDWDSFSSEKQDKLFMRQANKSGMNKYI